MTREEAISEVQLYARCINRDKYLEQVVNKIYNNHEAQLKLASDVYATDQMHMYQELKAKDDEIRRLNNLYADTIKDLGDALIEIERLKQELAWKLLCTDMAYGLHQYDTWEDVPNTTKESYLKNVSKD